MHRLTAWSLGAALAAGAAALPALAADPPTKPWYTRLLGSGSNTDAESKTFADLPPRPAVIVGPLDPSTRTQALRAEQDAWQRRMDVCHRLREIAAEANDDRLFTRADDLERQATALYHQRVTRLGVKTPPRGTGATLADDRQVVAGPGDLPAVSAPVPATPDRRFREVQP